MDYKPPLKGVWSGSRDQFFYFGSNHIFGIGEARHLTCRVQRSNIACMIDYSQKWMCSGSRDLFKFWEISDNISETVQDRDSCNGRLIGNRIWPIKWNYYR